MNLTGTPKSCESAISLQGRISITIGKIAVELRESKAQPCHWNGTKVIGPRGYISRERCEKVVRGRRFSDHLTLPFLREQSAGGL